MHVESTLNPIFLCLAGSSEERGPGPSGQTDGADFPHRWVSLVHRSMLYVDPETPPPPTVLHFARRQYFPFTYSFAFGSAPFTFISPFKFNYPFCSSFFPFLFQFSPFFSPRFSHSPPPQMTLSYIPPPRGREGCIFQYLHTTLTLCAVHSHYSIILINLFHAVFVWCFANCNLQFPVRCRIHAVYAATALFAAQVSRRAASGETVDAFLLIN